MKQNNKKNWIAVILTVIVLTVAVVLIVLLPKKASLHNNPASCNHHYEVIDEITADEFTPGKTIFKCTNCGSEKTERINATGSLPQLYLDGDMQGIAKDNEVFVKADYIDGDEVPFEKAPLERIAAEGQLNAFIHEGFWQCMDTKRDKDLLEKLIKEGNAPWIKWED